jgi:hypothetical protein
MPIYTVHVPLRTADPVIRADRTALVREGFNIWAFLFGPLFLLRHRAWASAAFWLVAVIAGTWICVALQLPGGSRALLLLLLQLFLGFEGNALRRRALDGRGYELAGVVAAAGREDAELRFLRDQMEAVPSRLEPASPALARSVPLRPAPAQTDEVIGLFPSQGA